MTTYSAITTLGGRQVAEQLGEAMERLNPEPVAIGVIEIEDGSGRWEVAAHFTAPPDDTGLELLALAFGSQPFVVSEVPETDWVAHVRRELHPVEAGRFFLFGTHDAKKVPNREGIVPLVIDAAMAFGTGHHGTTHGCLLALDRLLEQGVRPETVADVGCGTAVLAMAAAAALPARVIASDIDPVAIEVAKANLRANRLEDRVRCHIAAGFDHPDLSGVARFDLVFANILKGPLLEMANPMARAVKPSGYAILSGILNEQAAEVERDYRSAGFNTVDRVRIVDWTTLVIRRDGPNSAEPG